MKTVDAGTKDAGVVTSQTVKSKVVTVDTNPFAWIVDLGRKSRKKVKRLRKGKGQLIEDVQEALLTLKADGSIPESAVPVIVLVREKESPKALNFWGFRQ